MGGCDAAATGSYIQVDPNNGYIYSAGGPTGEVHRVDPKTGGFGDKLQELLYVEEDELAKADKTRKALVSPPLSFSDPPIRRLRACRVRSSPREDCLYQIDKLFEC